MSRAIVFSGNKQKAAVAAETADSYATKILKLLPVEVVAFFMTADAIVYATTGQPAADPMTLAIYFGVIAALGLITTPLYLIKQGVTSRSQLVGSTVGFGVWGFATSGTCRLLLNPNPALASLLVLAFTLIAPLFITEAKPDAAKNG